MKPSPTAPHCGTSASASTLRANPSDASRYV
jgi:hypothetical protein